MPEPSPAPNNRRIAELERRLAALERTVLRDASGGGDAPARAQQVRRVKFFPNATAPYALSTAVHFLVDGLGPDVRHKTKKQTARDINRNHLIGARTGLGILQRDAWWLLPHLAAGRYSLMYSGVLSNSNTSVLLQAAHTTGTFPLATQIANIVAGFPGTSVTMTATDPGLYIIMCFGGFMIDNANGSVHLNLSITGSGVVPIPNPWLAQCPVGKFGQALSTSFVWSPETANATMSMRLQSGAGTTSTSWQVFPQGSQPPLSCVILELARNAAVTGLSYTGGLIATPPMGPESPADAVGSAPNGGFGPVGPPPD